MKLSLLEISLSFSKFTALHAGVALVLVGASPSTVNAQSTSPTGSVAPPTQAFPAAPVTSRSGTAANAPTPPVDSAPVNSAPNAVSNDSVPVDGSAAADGSAPPDSPAPMPAAPPANTEPAPQASDASSAPLAATPPVTPPAAATVDSPSAPPAGTVTDPAAGELARPAVPSREARPFAIWGAMGWNSIAGFAFGASYSFTPHLTADAALGLSAIGPKTGARLRYNVLASNWTPSFGLGIQYGPGSDRQITVQGQSTSIDPNDEDADAVVTIERSAFVQAIAAMTYQGAGGFNALFGLGYAILLDKDNVRQHSGGERTGDIVRLVAGSGIVLEVGLGYAF